jgi:hypothetical protein
MNERIKELAEQAALLGPTSRVGNAHEAAERFAELVRQDEREKFVKFLMDLHADYEGDHNYYHCAANLFKEQA